MQQARKKLTLKGSPVVEEGEAGDTLHVLRTAIALKVCATAIYNRMTMRIAPHILYTRHEDPFMDGVVVERDGKPPREIKLGAFKLAGLGEVSLTSIPFTPLDAFDPGEERYAGTTLNVVRR